MAPPRVLPSLEVKGCMHNISCSIAASYLTSMCRGRPLYMLDKETEGYHGPCQAQAREATAFMQTNFSSAPQLI